GAWRDRSVWNPPDAPRDGIWLHRVRRPHRAGLSLSPGEGVSRKAGPSGRGALPLPGAFSMERGDVRFSARGHAGGDPRAPAGYRGFARGYARAPKGRNRGRTPAVLRRGAFDLD